MSDPYKEQLSCDLLPYNLTNQLLRIINASSRSAGAAPPPPQNGDKTPGLDAFAFDYAVTWPVSLVLSRNAIVKYQLIFRHLFHCKHVERQLSTSWLSQQARARGRVRSCEGARAKAMRDRQCVTGYV